MLLLRVQVGMGQGGEAGEKIEGEKKDGSLRVIAGNRDYIVDDRERNGVALHLPLDNMRKYNVIFLRNDISIQTQFKAVH